MTRREPDRDVRDRVREAFDALLANGVRPTGDRIIAWLLAKYGKAGSLREIHPAFAELRDKRTKAATVGRFVGQYQRMDVLQREAVRKLLDAFDACDTGSVDSLRKCREALDANDVAFGHRETTGMPGHSMQEAETERDAT